MLALAAACLLGALAGLAFAWLWLCIVPRGTNRRFWSALSALTREMLRVDEAAALFALYRRLGGLLGRYLARNLGGTLVACLPMIAILVVAAPLLPERTAWCSSPGYCALFTGLGFEVIEVEPTPRAAPYRVVRAEREGVNPLWPFLSDAEAVLFAAFIVSTFAGLLWPTPRPSLKPATTP